MTLGLAIAGVAGLAALSWLLFVAGRHRFAHVPATESAAYETVAIPAVDGTRMEGWLAWPTRAAPPLVIMAPGLLGTKEGPVETIAVHFVGAGMAVLMLDFRTLGGSDGAPRHWIDPLRQIDDYRSAIAFARSALAARIDVSRIALWGTSFSGSAAICAAARSDGIAAVVAQVPYLGGLPVHLPGRLQIAGYIALAIAEVLGDRIAGLFGITLAPVYITTYGKPGERTFAMSADNPGHRGGSTGETLHPFWAATSDRLRGGWENRMLVRGLQSLDKVSARDEIAKVACPVLLIGAVRDDMISFETVRTAARLTAGNCRFVAFDCGHYDVYVPPILESNLDAQRDFLRSVLLV